MSLLETLKTREDGEEHRSYELKFSVSLLSLDNDDSGEDLNDI